MKLVITHKKNPPTTQGSSYTVTYTYVGTEEEIENVEHAWRKPASGTVIDFDHMSSQDLYRFF